MSQNVKIVDVETGEPINCFSFRVSHMLLVALSESGLGLVPTTLSGGEVLNDNEYHGQYDHRSLEVLSLRIHSDGRTMVRCRINLYRDALYTYELDKSYEKSFPLSELLSGRYSYYCSY